MLGTDNNCFRFDYTMTNKTNIMDLQHFHYDYEMYILLNGEREYQIANASVKVTAPSVLVIRPGILHKAFSSNESLRMSAHLSFSHDFLSRFSDCLPDILTSEKYACILLKHDFEALNHFVEYIKENYQSSSIYAEELIRCGVYSFFCCLEQSELLFELPISEAIPDDTAIRILEYLKDHISESFGLRDMAKHFGFNTQRISKLMKEYIGTSYKDYISTLRLRKAINMLIYSDLTIGEVAFECGFESANYFGDFFHGKMGMSPRNYRNIHQKNDFTGATGSK